MCWSIRGSCHGPSCLLAPPVLLGYGQPDLLVCPRKAVWTLLLFLKKSSQHQKSLLWDWTLKSLQLGMDFSKVSGLPSPFSLQAALVALNALEHRHSKQTGTDCRCHGANPSGMGFLRAAEGCITFCLFGSPSSILMPAGEVV